MSIVSVYDLCPCSSGKKIKFCHKDINKCGLCNKKRKITLTECCNKSICDDEDLYELFSFSNNSCSRNHRTGTLCSYHYQEKHEGSWEQCDTCKSDFSTEIYSYYAMSDYNFEKQKNLFVNTVVQCYMCHKDILIGFEDATLRNQGYICGKCYPI